MPNITLPDGKRLTFDDKVSGIKIAEKISKSLAKDALVMSVNGNLKDLSYEIESDSSVKIFTSIPFLILLFIIPLVLVKLFSFALYFLILL